MISRISSHNSSILLETKVNKDTAMYHIRNRIDVQQLADDDSDNPKGQFELASFRGSLGQFWTPESWCSVTIVVLPFGCTKAHGRPCVMEGILHTSHAARVYLCDLQVCLSITRILF